MSLPRHSSVKSVTLLLAALLISGCFAGPKKARILERAENYFKAGDYDKAKVEYLNLLRLDNQNVRAFQQIGFIWMEQGVPLRAVPFLLRVRELAPQDMPARTKLAMAFEVLRQLTEARKEALAVLGQDFSNSDALLLLADSSQSKEDIAEAEQQLEKFPEKNTATFHLAAATLAARKGDATAAADQTQQAAAAEPKSAEAHLRLGYLYVLRKNKDHARAELATAAHLAPLRSEGRIKYAEFQAANGAADEAAKLLKEITRQAPDYIPAWRDLAQIASTEKNYDQALSLLENVFSRDPENPEARLLQSGIFLAKGDSKKATDVLDRLNTAYPGNAVVKYRLAQAYLSGGNANQATIALEEAVAANPKFVEATLALCQLYVRSGKSQQARLPLEDLVKKYPNLTVARTTLADAYAQLGRLDDVVSLFQDEVKLEPSSAEAHFRLGLVLRQQKKNKEARAAFEKAVGIAQRNLGAVDQLVQLDLLDRNFESARKRVEDAQKENPASADVFVMESKIYMAQRDWAHAEEALQKAMKVDPNSRVASALLVSAYTAENKLPELRSQLEAEVTKHPSNNAALMQLGILYERLNEFSKAAEVYEKVLANAPEAIPAMNNLAYLYAEHLSQLDKAYELARRARSLDANEPSVADTLGWILYKRKEYQQAAALLQESGTKLADNPEVQFHLGMASSMMGQIDVARAAFERAVQSSNDFPGKEEAKRRLASLQNASAPHSGSESARTDDVVALTRAAEAAEKKGQLAEAAAAYQKARQVNPKLLSATLQLAKLYAGPLHDISQALDLAKTARTLAPNDPQTAVVAGHIALQGGNFSWAYSLLHEAARNNSNDPDVSRDLALAAYALGKVPEAEQNMQAVLKAKPNTPEAKDFMQFTALETPSPEAVASEQEITAKLREQPDYVPALMAMAAIQLQRDQPKAAAVIYSNVLQKYPDFAPAQKRLAAIYAEDSDELARAYDLAMKARKALPDDFELAQILARISFKRKEFPYAVQLFQESELKKPLTAKDLYYLGVSQLQIRQAAKGRETLQKALAAGLQDPLAGDAKSRLADHQQSK